MPIFAVRSALEIAVIAEIVAVVTAIDRDTRQIEHSIAKLLWCGSGGLWIPAIAPFYLDKMAA